MTGVDDLGIFDDFSVDKFLVGEFDVGVVIVVVVVDDIVVVVVVIVVVENDANDEGLETLTDIRASYARFCSRMI